MTKPTRVIPAKAGIQPWGHDAAARNRTVGGDGAERCEAFYGRGVLDGRVRDHDMLQSASREPEGG